MSLPKIWERILHLFLPKKLAPPTIKLIEKGYLYEASSWQTYSPYRWRFIVDRDEIDIIYDNDTTIALWSVYINNNLKYTGNYTGMIERYPYIYDYIEYM
jgi:hypothetical protein